MYPIMLKIDGRRCICIGGGEVAARKVLFLCSCGAKVTIISPVLHDTLKTPVIAGQMIWIADIWQSALWQECDIVICATDNQQINYQCAAMAKEHGALVNVVDDEAASDFIMPAVAVMGNLMIAVGTGGTNPRLASVIRADLEERYTTVGACEPALTGYRKIVRNLLPASCDRSAFWCKLLDQEMLQQVVRGEWNLAEEKIRRAISNIGIKL